MHKINDFIDFTIIVSQIANFLTVCEKKSKKTD